MCAQIQLLLLSALLVCCSSNLFIGRISTRPSAGKRSDTAQWNREVFGPDPTCTANVLEPTVARMIALRSEMMRLSNRLSRCGVTLS
ncbi:hypothetical protein Q1695_006625 [Nippostrongylus brasiliensis]|nr:hypothetical protein Q1695_006625 [Nippostrongylus brasiliensis]